MARDVDRLILRLYEAALEPQMWTEVLAEISEALDGSTTYLCHVPLKVPGVGRTWTHGFDPEVLAVYKRDFSTPAWRGVAAHLTRPVGQIFDARDVFGETDYERDPGVRAFLLPQGFVNVLSAPVFREGGGLSAFLACRTAGDGELDGRAREALAQLMPHLEAAMRVHNRLYLASAEITNLRGALDVVDIGVIFLDRHLRIHYANDAALRTLEKADGARVRQGRLAISDSRAATQLEEAVCRCAADQSAANFGDFVIARRFSGAANLSLFIAPAVGRSEAIWSPQACAVAFLTDPEEGSRLLKQEWIQEGFGLTPTEARVARLVGGGSSVPEAAIALNMSINTAKTHMKSIYAKVGVRHQAELARVLFEAIIPLSTPRLEPVGSVLPAQEA